MARPAAERAAGGGARADPLSAARRRGRLSPNRCSGFQILETGAFDARGFSSSANDIVSRSADLAIAYAKLGVNPYFLMDTLRAYVVTQVKGPRCADSTSEAMTPAAFNAALARTMMDQYVQPIDGTTLIPSRVLGAARLEPYWQTGQARALRQAAIDLRGSGVAPVPLKFARPKSG